eukprot:scaffold23145_cov59-Attheya_sp.AAC.1
MFLGEQVGKGCYRAGVGTYLEVDPNLLGSAAIARSGLIVGMGGSPWLAVMDWLECWDGWDWMQLDLVNLCHRYEGMW